MTGIKIPLSGIGGHIFHVLSPGDPPITSLDQLGFAPPQPIAPAPAPPPLEDRATFWQAYEWQP